MEHTAQVTMDADKTCVATFGYPVGGIVVPVSRLGLGVPRLRSCHPVSGVLEPDSSNEIFPASSLFAIAKADEM